MSKVGLLLSCFFVLGSVAFGHDLACVPSPPAHDFTFVAGEWLFGLVDYGADTDIYYGSGAVSIPLHFWSVVALLGVVPAAMVAIAANATRQRSWPT